MDLSLSTTEREHGNILAFGTREAFNKWWLLLLIFTLFTYFLFFTLYALSLLDSFSSLVLLLSIFTLPLSAPIIGSIYWDVMRNSVLFWPAGIASSQDNSQGSLLPGNLEGYEAVQRRLEPPPWLGLNWSPVGYCRNDYVWLLMLSLKRHCDFFLAPFGALALGETSHHVVRRFSPVVCAAQNWGLLLTASLKLVTMWAILNVNLQLPFSLQMTATAFNLDTLSQNNPVKLFVLVFLTQLLFEIINILWFLSCRYVG